MLDAAIAARSAVLDGVRDAADISQKLERMVHDPEPVYLSRGRIWNATTAPRNDESNRSAAEDVWRQRLSYLGKNAVVVLPRADCRKIESLTVDIERCAPADRPTSAEQN